MLSFGMDGLTDSQTDNGKTICLIYQYRGRKRGTTVRNTVILPFILTLYLFISEINHFKSLLLDS